MPVTTPFVKVAATRSHGAEVVLDGETVAEAEQRCGRILAERGLTLVHPYDDPRIMAGQGTIALEMLEEVPDLDVLVIPIGGGGLIAGNAIAARARQAVDRDRRRRSRALPVGVERAAQARARPIGGPTLAEGIAVKNVGKLTLAGDPRTGGRDRPGQRGAARARGQRLPDAAEDHGGRRGRRGLAAMLAKPERFHGKKVGLILCGGNIDPRILASIMVRELERETRIVSFRLTIPDRPGVLGADRHQARRRSAPTSSRSITAGCCSTCRPRAPSSTSPSRRATPPTPRKS